MWQFLVSRVVLVTQGWHLTLLVDIMGFRPTQVQS